MCQKGKELLKEKKYKLRCSLFSTFLRNAIREDGGIPGFELLAEKIETLSDLSESPACFKASSVSFVLDETCKNTNR